MDGSLPALICGWIWRRQLYVRTGFTLSRIVSKTSPGNWLRHSVAYINELLAFRCAGATSVSSRFDMEYVTQRYGNKISARLAIVGNYVDTQLFSPSILDEGAVNRVLYVGRLSPEKNLDNAIAACASVGIGLDIVGGGGELPRLKEIAAECRAQVRWLGVIPNKQLSDLLKSYRYFILPSHWEGLPKSLIEAMSAGLVCIGNDTTGINEIIEDGVTGYLSPSCDAAALVKTLFRALAGDSERISRTGREFVCREFSLEAIAVKEQAIFTKLLAPQGPV
jgi:glycosyltransferase involved in cell wall biosynthesis